MEQNHHFLSLCLPLGLVAGSALGVLIWVFTDWLFAISIGAGLGMLAGIGIGTLLDRQSPISCPGFYSPGNTFVKSSEKGQALFCTQSDPLHRMIVSKAENTKRFTPTSF